MRPSPELSVVDLDTARLPGHRVRLAVDQPLRLDCGAELSPITVAYQTYGQLNPARSNAILVCHALTGDQFAAEPHPITGKDGWWHLMIGPGKTLDTDRYFVICANVLGGCMGTTGPIETNPKTGEPYGLSFPGDHRSATWCGCRRCCSTTSGIERLFCVTGGSMGGMQVLEWAARYPERVFSAVPIASAARHSAQNIAFHEVGRQAIMADPDWQGGNYLRTGRRPTRGLSVARMAAHITYLSEAALHRKFGRALQDRTGITYGFDADFQVESYLRYQGISFVDRFDANSYLYITRAMDYFDLAASYDGVLANAFRGSQHPVLRDLVHLRLAVPDRGKPRAGARAHRGGRQRVVLRDRDRSRARCVPARRAGVPPRARGLSGWRRELCAGCADPSDGRSCDPERPAPGSAPDRGSGRAEHARARCGLRRWRAARVSRPDQAGRRARHRAQPGRRARVRQPRACGDSGRCRQGPGRSSPTRRSTT